MNEEEMMRMKKIEKREKTDTMLAYILIVILIACLGVILFSDEQTLIEELGYEEVKMELMKRSNFYERNLMKGSDLKIILNEQVK